MTLPTPYYQDEHAVIYHADCRDVLPLLGPVDCTVTSPPYNTLKPTKPSGMHASHSGARNFIDKAMNAGYADDKPESEYQSWLRDIVGLCIASTNGLVWVNHKLRHRNGVGIHPLRFLPFNVYAEVVWHRDGAIQFNSERYPPCHEMWYAFGRKTFWDRCNNLALTVWQVPSEKGKAHPCPFPLLFPKRFISSSCKPDGIVCDPLAGSGTTLVAAKLEGRKSVGIEIEERYCEIAVNRLRQGVLF